MAGRKPAILPGEDVCGCVEIGRVPTEFETFARICECMYTQNSVGDSVCNKCHGDIYACDCPLAHSRRCEEKA